MPSPPGSTFAKNKMFKLLHKNSDNLVFTEKYKAYRNALNRLLRLAKRNYYHSVLNEHKGNSQKVWQVVNELAFTKDRTGLLPSKLVTSNGHTVTDEETIAEEFNSYFVNSGKSMADAISSGLARNFNFSATNKNSNSLFLTPSCPQEVFNVIKKLKIKTARRTNDVEAVFIKYANPVISKFLSDMCNVCLSEGTYPDLLKIAEVVPIFKKGERNKMTNYRPISLLLLFNKVFEKLLYTRVYTYLTRFNLISDHQFGFRKNCSPTLAINKLYDEILTSIDQGLYSCGFFLDLSKTFNTVNHDILLQKLENFFGIRGKSQEILKSYLTNQCQYTKVGNAKSSNQNINCGVPQGLTLGSLLFIMHVNNLPSASEFSTTLFRTTFILYLRKIICCGLNTKLIFNCNS